MDDTGTYLKGFMSADGAYIEANNPPEVRLALYPTKMKCFERLSKAYDQIPSDIFAPNIKLDYTKLTILPQNPSDLKRGKHELGGLNRIKNKLIPWVAIYRRRLPDHCFEWSIENKFDYIAGAFDGDGCCHERESGRCAYQITSIEKQWLDDMKRLLGTLGIVATVGLNHGKTTGKFPDGSVHVMQEMWVLRLSIAESGKLSRMIKFTRLRHWTPYNYETMNKKQGRGKLPPAIKYSNLNAPIA